MGSNPDVVKGLKYKNRLWIGILKILKTKHYATTLFFYHYLSLTKRYCQTDKYNIIWMIFFSHAFHKWRKQSDETKPIKSDWLYTVFATELCFHQKFSIIYFIKSYRNTKNNIFILVSYFYLIKAENLLPYSFSLYSENFLSCVDDSYTEKSLNWTFILSEKFERKIFFIYLLGTQYASMFNFI